MGLILCGYIIRIKMYPEPTKIFLRMNGFMEGTCEDDFHLGRCRVYFRKNKEGDYDHYEVEFGDGSMFSTDLSIYWLIGVLTYYDLMPREYKTKYESED